MNNFAIHTQRANLHMTSVVLETRRRLHILLLAYEAKLEQLREELNIPILGKEPVTFMLRQRVERLTPETAAELTEAVHALIASDPVKLLRDCELSH